MLNRLFLLLAGCSPAVLLAQSDDPVADYAKLLPGKWEVVVAYGWVEFPDGRRIDQPMEMPGKMTLEFSVDGGYHLLAEGEESVSGSYQLDEATLTITADEQPDVQRIEHLNDSRCVIATSDPDPKSGATLWMRMVLIRTE